MLIESDIPSLSAQDLRAAFDALELRVSVFAPTENGGYALVGCREPIDPVFEEPLNPGTERRCGRTMLDLVSRAIETLIRRAWREVISVQSALLRPGLR